MQNIQISSWIFKYGLHYGIHIGWIRIHILGSHQKLDTKLIFNACYLLEAQLKTPYSLFRRIYGDE